ncbi:MAG: hypothetical protein M3495_16000 [Pseudomonadota bacterium]|nr:hypothetical protein [Pseudomonadota bacterium]
MRGIPLRARIELAAFGAKLLRLVDVQYVIQAEVARLILFRYGTVHTRYT